MLRYLLSLLALTLGLSLPLAAQENDVPERAEIISLIGRMAELLPIEREFRALGFEGENLELAMEQYRRVFADPDIAAYVADRLIEAYSGQLSSALDAGGLIGPLVERGLGHLPTRDLAYFYEVENAIFNAMPVRICGLTVKQRVSERQLSDQSARLAARLNTPALRQYYNIQYQAARLGLTHEQIVLTPAQRASAQQLIGERIFENVDDADTARLLRAFENPRRASNRQACEAARTVMNKVLTLEGAELREALLYFSTP